MKGNERKVYDLAIVGGGAAGLCAAVSAVGGNSSLAVALLERQPRVGRKLLATGNGRCNFTNLNLSLENYYGADKSLATPVLRSHTPEDNIAFFQTLGIYPRFESQGRVYPYSGQAGAVVDALRLAAAQGGVDLQTETEVTAIKKAEPGYILLTSQGEIACRKLLLAAGGQASPGLGGSDKGYKLCRALGHTVSDLAPALVQLQTENSLTKAWQGLRFQGAAALCRGSQVLAQAQGEILFTEYGLSGIAALSLSCALPGQAETGLTVNLDFSPELSEEDMRQLLLRRREELGYLTLENYLTGLLNKKIGQLILKRVLGRQLSYPVSQLSAEDIAKAAQALKNLPLALVGHNGWRNAQVTAGGVSLREINTATMESKLCPGLYLAGEILSLHGDCGGYNLHWAWSGGRLAAESAVAALGKEKC